MHLVIAFTIFFLNHLMKMADAKDGVYQDANLRKRFAGQTSRMIWHFITDGGRTVGTLSILEKWWINKKNGRRHISPNQFQSVVIWNEFSFMCFIHNSTPFVILFWNLLALLLEQTPNKADDVENTFDYLTNAIDNVNDIFKHTTNPPF